MMVVTTNVSPKGQRVEYRQYPSSSTSLAESKARVVVSGKTVATGWSCDGVTYDIYRRAVQEGW
jgi:hypothetical protein